MEQLPSYGSDRFASHLFRSLGVPPKSSIRILDFGGGVDAVLSLSLARRFVQHGTRSVKVTLVDYNASCPLGQSDAVTVECCQDLSKAAVTGTFNVVIASAIVEHVPYPRENLLTLLNSLCAGGRAYFRTPAMASIIRAAARFGAKIKLHLSGSRSRHGPVLLGERAGHAGHRARLYARAIAALHRGDGVSGPPYQDGHRACFQVALVRCSRKNYSMVGGWEAVFAKR